MSQRTPDIADRLAARERPKGTPVMHQSWDNLLFMHWEVPVEALRRLIPRELKIDTFEGRAYVAITPLYIWDVRPVFMPAVPWLSTLNELNVRTYVYYDGVPGVWFFSLDANNFPAVLGARLFFSLPYFNADIKLEKTGGRIEFESVRTKHKPRFRAGWTIGDPLPKAEPGTLDFFLVERYCLYTAQGNKIYRCRIHHEPWPLQETVNFSGYHSTMLAANCLPEPTTEPLLHCGGPVHVEIWRPERI